MSKYNPMISLRQMMESAQEALDLVEGKTKEEALSNHVLQLALRKLLEILGEAANRVPGEIQRQYPQIEWMQIISMRNRLIHGYDQLDLDLLWEVLEQDLSPLLDRLKNGPHFRQKPNENSKPNN